MRIHTMHWIAALALTGCATAGRNELSVRQMDFGREFASGVLCTTSDCMVKVSVGASCAISVDPPTLGIDASLDDATIHWVIQPGAAGRVSFQRDGINGKFPAWLREFRNPKLVSPTEYTWIDKNRLQGEPRKRPYAYNVEIIQDGNRCRLDPTIVNEY